MRAPSPKTSDLGEAAGAPKLDGGAERIADGKAEKGATLAVALIRYGCHGILYTAASHTISRNLVLIGFLGVRQCVLHVGNARQEDRIVLVMVVSLEDKLVPVVRLQAEFE